MISPSELNEIHNKLSHIQKLAAEIEAVPNLLPDMWTMEDIDKKCREIQQECKEIGESLGTGDGRPGSSGSGY
jgi:hypothetical protein